MDYRDAIDRLKKIQDTPADTPTKPTEATFVSSVITPHGAFSKIAPTDEWGNGAGKDEGVDLTARLAEACQDVEGIDAATFRSLLSAVDVEDIEDRHIPVVTLNAYAKSFAEGIRTGRMKVLDTAAPQAPRTSRVRCADCQHFERDTVGDGNGIGCCRVQGEGTGLGQPALCLG